MKNQYNVSGYSKSELSNLGLQQQLNNISNQQQQQQQLEDQQQQQNMMQAVSMAQVMLDQISGLLSPIWRIVFSIGYLL